MRAASGAAEKEERSARAVSGAREGSVRDKIEKKERIESAVSGMTAVSGGVRKMRKMGVL